MLSAPSCLPASLCQALARAPDKLQLVLIVPQRFTSRGFQFQDEKEVSASLLEPCHRSHLPMGEGPLTVHQHL